MEWCSTEPNAEYELRAGTGRRATNRKQEGQMTTIIYYPLLSIKCQNLFSAFSPFGTGKHLGWKLSLYVSEQFWLYTKLLLSDVDEKQKAVPFTLLYSVGSHSHTLPYVNPFLSSFVVIINCYLREGDVLCKKLVNFQWYVINFLF